MLKNYFYFRYFTMETVAITVKKCAAIQIGIIAHIEPCHMQLVLQQMLYGDSEKSVCAGCQRS